MAAAEGVPPARRGPRRLRRRLRTRIILSFLLLGTGLTALFAFLADYSRQRVENQLVEDVMNRNIDEYARLYALDPSRSVVVEACAGSGKTWLLASRVVRLLLGGVAPG